MERTSASEADVTSSYEDGILEVRLPAPWKAPVSTSKTIPVTRC